MRIATFDFGTTAIKFVVLDEKANILYNNKIDIDTIIKDDFIEQSPNQWLDAFKNLIKSYKERNQLTHLICSGQMQDLIFIDKNNNPLYNAILYNDQRGDNYLDKIDKEIEEKTTIHMNGSIPLSKMYWVKENEPKVLENTKNILFSPKDFITIYLTNIAVADTTTLSTTGMMDIYKKEYIDTIEVNKEILPKILNCGDVVNTIDKNIALELGLNPKLKVFAGSGDAGATTLASGIVKDNELNINLGTSGWIANISKSPNKEAFNLCAINEGYYINVIPVLNASSVHKWVTNLIFKDNDNKYDFMDKLLDENINYDTDLLTLPYLVGERYPVADNKIKGCYFGLNPNTSLVDLAISALEGVAYSLKQGIVELGVTPKTISLIGGGALTKAWNQIFANIFEVPITVYSDSEYLPSISLTSSVLIHEGFINSYEEFISDLLSNQDKQVYLPQVERFDKYRDKFTKFKKLYPSLKVINE
ncbi:MAG: FGGY family carbohydrate kinase [Sphaerochaetaceae bacterium]|nr:FGGY family carbohydrate kinase [Sphaerochaetaceae bacterium]